MRQLYFLVAFLLTATPASAGPFMTLMAQQKTATGTPNCGDIGYTTVGSSSGSYAGSDAYTVTNSGETCMINRICAYIEVDDPTPGNLLLAGYAKTGAHTPGALLFETSALTLPADPGWVCGTFAEYEFTASTSIYLSFLADEAARYYYDAGSTDAVYKNMTYASGHDDPYGSPGGNIDRDISIYVNHN